MCLCFNYDDFQSITARTSRFCEFPGVRRAESSVGRDGDSTGFSMDSTWAANMGKFTNQHGGCGILHLIGGLELFSIYWECHHPNWRIFFRGVVLPPTSHVWCLLVYSWCATIDRVGMRFFCRSDCWCLHFRSWVNENNPQNEKFKVSRSDAH